MNIAEETLACIGEIVHPIRKCSCEIHEILALWQYTVDIVSH